MTKLNYLPTWQGVTYVCFITGAFSWMIVGWRAAAHKRIEMVLDALEMARWQRNTCFERFCCCSDAGSQFVALRYTERFDEIEARPSMGSVGGFIDNALA